MFVLDPALGRRELSSLEPFDVILLVVIGDLVQQGITQSDDSVTGTLIVLSTIAPADRGRVLRELPRAGGCARCSRASRSS